jgi:hypothetical protein
MKPYDPEHKGPLPQGYDEGGGVACGNCKHCYFFFSPGWEDEPDRLLYCQHGVVDALKNPELVGGRMVNELDVCIEYKPVEDFGG